MCLQSNDRLGEIDKSDEKDSCPNPRKHRRELQIQSPSRHSVGQVEDAVVDCAYWSKARSEPAYGEQSGVPLDARDDGRPGRNDAFCYLRRVSLRSFWRSISSYFASRCSCDGGSYRRCRCASCFGASRRRGRWRTMTGRQSCHWLRNRRKRRAKGRLRRLLCLLRLRCWRGPLRCTRLIMCSSEAGKRLWLRPCRRLRRLLRRHRILRIAHRRALLRLTHLLRLWRRRVRRLPLLKRGIDGRRRRHALLLGRLRPSHHLCLLW